MRPTQAECTQCLLLDFIIILIIIIITIIMHRQFGVIRASDWIRQSTTLCHYIREYYFVRPMLHVKSLSLLSLALPMSLFDVTLSYFYCPPFAQLFCVMTKFPVIASSAGELENERGSDYVCDTRRRSWLGLIKQHQMPGGHLADCCCCRCLSIPSRFLY